MSATPLAKERYSLDTALQLLEEEEGYARTLFARLMRIGTLPQVCDVLDIGAAQGLFLIGCTKLGHRAVGLEPWAQARTTGLALAEHLEMTVDIRGGLAENLPFDTGSFDIVRANSVVEHVANVEAMFSEVYRVLRPRGIFWFQTASSICPRQGEIRGFPLFSWYPGVLKLRAMNWALKNKPELIGHTMTPAVHWFTPPKARRMLRAAGFSRVYDRWDLRLESEGGAFYKLALRLVRFNNFTKLIGDFALPCCAYAAVKQ
jgi:SAM-dependent methyltransferase